MLVAMVALCPYVGCSNIHLFVSRADGRVVVAGSRTSKLMTTFCLWPCLNVYSHTRLLLICFCKTRASYGEPQLGWFFCLVLTTTPVTTKGFFENVFWPCPKKNKNEKKHKSPSPVDQNVVCLSYMFYWICYLWCPLFRKCFLFALFRNLWGAGSDLGKYGRTIKWPVIYAKPNWIVNGIKGIVWFWQINCTIFGLNVFSGLVLFW